MMSVTVVVWPLEFIEMLKLVMKAGATEVIDPWLSVVSTNTVFSKVDLEKTGQR